jgi:hypothetical protein
MYSAATTDHDLLPSPWQRQKRIERITLTPVQAVQPIQVL